ncbi:MAG: sulfite exporter TauE/SafE family protein [Silicimonas sp.]|nr:sulfite exporter TauE/SafE family protein [Silicimonas sp.]
MPRQTFRQPQGCDVPRRGPGDRSKGGRAIEIDLTFLLIGVPAVILAGVSKGGFGSGASFVAAPMLALILPPEMALGILMPVLLLIDAVTLKPYWRRWDMRQSILLLLGAVPGVALGILFWRIANPDMLRLLIGVIALGFVAHQIAGRLRPAPTAPRPAPRAIGLLAGCVSAFTSFVSHAGGPVAAVYLLSQGLSKTGYQATTVLVFGVVNVAKTISYVFLGAITLQSMTAGLYLVPAALLGAWLGVVAHRAIPERAFFLVTYSLLLAAGAKLIFHALT